MSRRLLIPNVAAEEGAAWRGLGRLAAVRKLVRLWRLLFAPDHFLPDDVPHEPALDWPPDLGAPPDAAVFAWLDPPERAHAWLNTEEALALAAASGYALAGPAPAVVAHVHDKAFAHRIARDAGLLPAPLAETIHVFDPADLRAPDAVDRVRARISAWPAWLGGRYTLKPRFGSSGRGRVGGSLRDLDPAALGRALRRLADRRGALLEPWLERDEDLSVQLWIDPDGPIVVLGSLAQRVSASGVYRGHRGIVDARGRVRSDSRWDEALREAALQVALGARDAGFHGPCGVDAFSFRAEDGRLALRPVVELNARFTSGSVALGLVRRALGAVGPRLGLAPGAPLRFELGLEGLEEPGATAAGERPDTQRLALAPTSGAPGPVLRFARGEAGS